MLRQCHRQATSTVFQLERQSRLGIKCGAFAITLLAVPTGLKSSLSVGGGVFIRPGDTEEHGHPTWMGLTTPIPNVSSSWCAFWPPSPAQDQHVGRTLALTAPCFSQSQAGTQLLTWWKRSLTRPKEGTHTLK
ncbi:hypothetical protein WMY93_024920 [Mugilogobius chulae]|uniref:Uncharacterized protein n=1 Tax=Mugilogobius chulae TaxID=88201 RepID=A0AAW0N0X4_9GOBI